MLVEVPADHCHGHRSNATTVIVVSTQFDSVLVEQNHCQGLRTVANNCTLSAHVFHARKCLA
jgi:hypothetical protein